MTAIDRAALIEQAAQAIWEDSHPAPTWGVWKSAPWLSQRYHRQTAAPALPVIAKALLAPLRELHRRTLFGQCRCCNFAHPCPTVRLLDAIAAEVLA